eukprot:3115026-Prymnesium_polylepis.1
MVSDATLEMVDTLTTLDAKLYAAALARLLDDVRAVEHASGQQLLCAARLESLAQNISSRASHATRT